MLALKPASYSVLHALTGWLFLLALLPVLRQSVRQLMSRAGLWQKQTAIIGSGAAAERAYRAISKSVALGFDIQWLVALEPTAEIPAALSRLEDAIAPAESETPAARGSRRLRTGDFRRGRGGAEELFRSGPPPERVECGHRNRAAALAVAAGYR